MTVLLIVIAYITLLFAISRWAGKHDDNDTFYRGRGRSPWPLVAFGMIGASISGVTFVSVPGMVMASDMTYMQTCIGFVIGYAVVAFILLPVYYRLHLTTIYSYLGIRLGPRSYKTGAAFFILSKMAGATVRFYVVCIILQHFVMDRVGIPFPVTATLLVTLIWLYTHQGGIRTIVYTDSLQTLCLFTALVFIIIELADNMALTPAEAVDTIHQSGYSRMFVFDDWISKQNFWKQFLSGVFIVIVMTGLDQDMMQKNLTCRSLGDAQKDMCSYGLAFVPANLLFLSLGVLLVVFYQQNGITLPSSGDELLPGYVTLTANPSPITLPLVGEIEGGYSSYTTVLFTLGIVAAAFSSADSALTSLTTSVSIDILGRSDDERLRRRVHIYICILFVTGILAFNAINTTSAIDAIYILCGYTYGPLLGLFAYGILTRREADDRLVPYVCVASPLLCYALNDVATRFAAYHFGYELLMLNGLLTFTGLLLTSRHIQQTTQHETTESNHLIQS